MREEERSLLHVVLIKVISNGINMTMGNTLNLIVDVLEI
jgi:hypothetical protein